MGEWISVQHKFIVADVIRWKEKVYHHRRKRGGRPICVGKRLVSAEVLPETNDQWAFLKVIHCNVIDITPGRSVPVIFTGEVIKRSRKTIMRCELERLPWSD